MTGLLPGMPLPGELPLRVIRLLPPAPLELRCRCGAARTAAKDVVVIRMTAHAIACPAGAAQAARSAAPLPGEEPVRVLRPRPWEAASLVCVCGIEATAWRYGSTSESARLKLHLRQPHLRPDLSLEGLGSLLRHTATCPGAQAWRAAHAAVLAAGAPR